MNKTEDMRSKVEEMRKLLLEEFGIHNETELDAALKALGGINISAFVGTSAECPRIVQGQSADKTE